MVIQSTGIAKAFISSQGWTKFCSHAAASEGGRRTWRISKCGLLLELGIRKKKDPKGLFLK